MKYNRALDYTALALNEMSKGNHALAAKLLVKASKEPDFTKGIAILEHSNKAAFATALEAKAKLEASEKAKREVEAKTRLKAAEDEGEAEDMHEGEDEDGGDVEQDPLDEIVDEEDEEKPEPAAEMAAVLSSMVRRSSK